MSATLQKFVEQEKAASDQSKEQLRDLVRSLANDESIKFDEEVSSVLDATGTSAADLQSLVLRQKSRNRLRADMVAGAAATAERQQIDEQIRAAGERLAAARLEYNGVVNPAEGRLQEIRQIEQRAASAKQQLWLECSDSSLHEQVRALTAEMEGLHTKYNAVNDEVSLARAELREAKSVRSRENSPARLDAAQSRVEAAQKVLHEKQELLESLHQQGEDTRAEQDALLEQMRHT